MRTQVAIVGAGPAGLLLSHLLHRRGIESVVLEARTRDYVEQRVRAGVLEQGTVDTLIRSGAGERLQREGLVHHGIELRFGGKGHRIAFEKLVPGRAITVYGQQEVVKDLIATRLTAGGQILFEVEDVVPDGIDGRSPEVSFTHQSERRTIEADFIAGCDGFHGICRDVIPPGVLRFFDKEYPFGWLGVLAAVAPSSEELIYASNDRGFALHSMRSPEVSRFYLQVAPKEDIAEWSDERIWEELRARLETVPGWTLSTGPVLEKGITAMRSFVTEPMQFGRLFLAGDAAHIVPPTGAKGLNLAAFDVTVLTRALSAWYGSGDASLLDGYSQACLRRVWRAQHFSWWMTTLLHTFDHYDAYDRRLQESYLDYVCSSVAASTTLAENYVGLDMPDH
ncbi:MAG TPA: 4-hydroxybenzoate 3-monooxygenase [Streptosporangiaceae bacterium]